MCDNSLVRRWFVREEKLIEWRIAVHQILRRSVSIRYTNKVKCIPSKGCDTRRTKIERLLTNSTKPRKVCFNRKKNRIKVKMNETAMAKLDKWNLWRRRVFRCDHLEAQLVTNSLNKGNSIEASSKTSTSSSFLVKHSRRCLQYRLNFFLHRLWRLRLCWLVDTCVKTEFRYKFKGFKYTRWHLTRHCQSMWTGLLW